MSEASLPASVRLRFPEAAALAAGLAALVTLTGWALDIDALRGLLPSFKAMTVNTALGLAAVAAGLYRAARSGAPSRFAAALGVAAFALGAATLAERAFDVPVDIGELLPVGAPTTTGDAAHAAHAAVAGRMSLATALGLALAGVSLCAQALHRRPLSAQLLAIGTLGIGIVGLAGYVVDRTSLYAVGPFSSMSLDTAAALFALGSGLVFARPGIGLARPLGGEFLGATFARRLLPLAVLLPLLFVGIVAVAQRHSGVDASFALAVVATGSVLMLLALGWAAALAVERKERALRAERNELATLLASIGDGVIVTAIDTTVRFMNPVAERLTGLDGSAARGRPLREVFEPVDEHTLEPLGSPVREALLRGVTTSLRQPAVLRSRDGSVHPIEDSAAPVRSAEGIVEGVVLVFREVAERRRHEREQRDAAAAKDRFLATLAHELRNPLSPVLAGAALLKDPTLTSAERGDVVDTIERQTLQMVRLIDDLLDVSRLTRDRLQLRRERIRLAEVLELAVETARTALDAAGHALEIELAPDLPQLDADATRLVQLFSNLLLNAARYTPPGGHVRLAATRDGDGVRVDVSDDGTGIEASAIESVFGLYSQLSPGSVRGHMGLGIGLTLARAVAELHGGTLEATSAGPGLGSTFTARLPAAKALAEPMPERRVAPRAPVSSRRDGSPLPRVLVVDDNADGAAAVARLLAHRGHEVRTAADAEEALGLVDDFVPDACVLDIGLPGMDGYELARRLRARPATADALLIALTGWGRAEDVAAAHAAGFDHHLVKPVRAKALFELLGASSTLVS